MLFPFSPPVKGRMGSHSLLESQPVGDDPHVPLSHGAHLLHVVGDSDPLGGNQYPCGAVPEAHLLLWTRTAHSHHQPHLDTQEDHATAKSRGLELWE